MLCVDVNKLQNTEERNEEQTKTKMKEDVMKTGNKTK